MITVTRAESGVLENDHLQAIVQQLKEELAQDKWAVDIMVQVYPQTGHSPIGIQASSKKLGNKMHFTYGHLTILSTEACTIVVDKSARTVHYTEVSGALTLSGLQKQIGLGSAATDAGTKNWQFMGVRENKYIYRIPEILPGGTEMELLFSVSTLRLEGVDHKSRNAQDTTSLSVRYEWHDTSTLTEEQFSPARYVRRVGEHLVPSLAYSGYELIEDEHAQ